MNFLLFIQSIAQQALMALGLQPVSESSPVPLNHAHAKEMIDLLEMLQEKSKGNLTKEEEDLLHSLLYELRIVYLEVTKSESK